MDDISSNLIDHLLEKALENIAPQERLAFLEKLYGELPPESQQEFLLRFTRMLLEVGTQPAELQKVLDKEPCEPVMVRFYQAEADEFAPMQMCCQALVDLTHTPEVDENAVVLTAQMFNSLGDETRLKIVKLLSKGEFTVEELVELLGIAQSTTSHHLRVLKDAAMIKGEKRGRNIYYSIVKQVNTVIP
jgi:DNA-binding transcriptional ArsR family regulator